MTMMCVISGLPIEYGDKVRLVMLTKNPFVEQGGFPRNYEWFPRSLPIATTYDGDGTVGAIKNDSIIDIITRGFQLDLFEGNHEVCPGTPITRDISFDEIIDVLQCGNLEIHTHFEWNVLKVNTRPKRRNKETFPGFASVRMGLVREDVWEKILTMTDRDGLRFPSYIDSFIKNIEHIDVTNEETFDDRVRKICFSVKDGPGSDIFKSSAPFMVGTNTHIGLAFGLGPIHNSVVRAAAELAFVAEILETIGRCWRPSFRLGQSQSVWRNYVAFTKMVALIATNHRECSEG